MKQHMCGYIFYTCMYIFIYICVYILMYTHEIILKVWFETYREVAKR